MPQNYQQACVFLTIRDALRQAITDAIAVQGQGAQGFAAQVAGQALTAAQQVSLPYSELLIRLKRYVVDGS